MSAATTPAGRSWRLLRNRNFSLLWMAAVASAGGYYVGNVVIEWFIYGSSHHAIDLTLLGIVEFLPTLSIGIIAGAWVDRHDRRRLMVLSDVARAATLGALAVYVLTLGFSLPVVLLAVLVTGVFGTIEHPSSHAILPTLLAKDDLGTGNGILEAGTTVAGFVGSPLGGALILLVGVAAGLIVNALTFAISAFLIGLMILPASVLRTSPDGDPGNRSLLSDVGAGLRFLRSQRALLTLTLGSMAMNFFSFYLIYIVVYTSDLLHAGAAVFGVLVGAQSAGYAVGALLIAGKIRLDRAPGLWLPVAWGMGGLPLIVLIALPVVPVAVGSMLAMGVLTALVNITFVSVVQKQVPDQFLGRYFAIDQAGSYAMIPAGLAVGGLLIVSYGVGFAFLLAGAGTLAGGGALLLSRDVRRWGRA